MPERFSRGEVISLIAGIPAALAVTTEAAAADAVSDAKKRIGYVDVSKTKGATCATCSFFKATSGGNGTCPFVPGGTVKATGWCKQYHKK